MGKALLFGRLAAKDFRRHLSEGVLLFLVLAAATATLTLGLVLHGETTNPYNATRAATGGPDVVANLSATSSNNPSITTDADPAGLTSLEHAPGVTASSGPYPVTFALVKAHGVTTSSMLEGRDPTRTKIDQPALTAGSWVRPGGVVVERAFADALRVRVGDSLTLNGRSFPVAGIAVDAAIPAYPHVCGIGCIPIYRDSISHSQIAQYTPGLVWLSRSDAIRLATPIVGLSYVSSLKLADPAARPDIRGSPHSTIGASPDRQVLARTLRRRRQTRARPPHRSARRQRAASRTRSRQRGRPRRGTPLRTDPTRRPPQSRRRHTGHRRIRLARRTSRRDLRRRRRRTRHRLRSRTVAHQPRGRAPRSARATAAQPRQPSRLSSASRWR